MPTIPPVGQPPPLPSNAPTPGNKYLELSKTMELNNALLTSYDGMRDLLATQAETSAKLDSICAQVERLTQPKSRCEAATQTPSENFWSDLQRCGSQHEAPFSSFSQPSKTSPHPLHRVLSATNGFESERRNDLFKKSP